MRWLWLIGLLLLAAACGGLFYAFSNPGFLVGLAGAVGGLVWQAIAPQITKRMTPDDEKAFNEFLRSSPSPREIAEWHRKRRKR